MKQYIKLFSMLALTAAVTASCVDGEIEPFAIDKPESIAQYEYLNDYDVLKSYVDRQAHPNFHLGAAIGANDFINQGVVYGLVRTNFDEMTAGNEMKHASIVRDDGSVDFTTVTDFVEAAKEVGVTIYGHTLAWHSQQNNTYLNGIIADKQLDVDLKPVEVQDGFVDYSVADSYTLWNGLEPGASIVINEEGYLTITNPAAVDNYKVQYFVLDGVNWAADVDYNITVKARASGLASVTLAAGTWGGYPGTIMNLTEEWREVTVTVRPGVEGAGFVMMQSGAFVGTIDIEWVKVSHTEIPTSVSTWVNMVTNGDAEGDDVSSFYSTEPATGGPNPCVIGEAGTGADGVGRAFVVRSADNPVNTWDTQFFIKASRQLVAGDKYHFTMKYKADKAAGSETQAHNEPGGYVWYAMLPSNPSFTTEWQTMDVTGTISADQAGASGMNTIAFNLAVLGEANTYYFDDIAFEIEEAGNTEPLTPEEKKDTLTWAMNNWIAGMMKACEGYVTSWDAVNEAISGGDNDGDGWYDLQSASNVDDPSSAFFWQDYLGNEDYVPIVTQAAVKYFAEYGGNPADLKLFINDYNLESWWDNNMKLKSLIHWIEVWESKGAKIDGIGTQMHVSLILNEDDQKAQEASIVRMFELMAATGKLVKISELDMGITEKAFGAGIKTEDVTYEQQQKMADFYQFIIQKYFEIIPPAQQYGITQWCMNDSPADSGWRPGEPVGLWDSNYRRKPTYGGFANGLAGQVIVPPYDNTATSQE